MPRYYCDYCDTYLTHDSPVVRKQHNTGYKHKANVRQYYMQFEEAQTQDLIDSKIMEHLARAGAPDPSKLTAGSIPGQAGGAAPVGLPRPAYSLPPNAQFINIPPQSLQTPQPMAYRPPAVLPAPAGGMYRPPQSLPPPRQFAPPYQ